MSSIQTLRLKYRNKVLPLEKVAAGSKWWPDSDVRQSFSAKGVIDNVGDFDYDTTTTSKTYPAALKFVYLKCNNITSGKVLISFDGSDDGVLELSIGEAVVIRPDPAVTPRVIITDSAGVEYLTGT